MIKLQLIKSPDSAAIREFHFFHNQLYLGRSNGNLCIQDPELNRSHLMIEIVGSDLLVHPQKEVSHYLINGKRATEIRKIKLGDSLTIGKTEFKIVDFKETEEFTKKDVLDPKMKQLMQEGSERLGVIEKLVRLSK